jgi:hypothetical protein
MPRNEDDALTEAIWSEDRCTAGDGKCPYVIKNLKDYERHLERIHPDGGSAES